MRRRINRTLLTATAASASVITLGFMATGAVGASTTTAGLASTSSITPILSQATGCIRPATAALASTPTPCAVAGYQASGRLFRYAQASIVVPNHTADATPGGTPGSSSTTDIEPDAAVYVALDNSSNTANDFARAGIVACAAVTVPNTGSTPGVWPCPGTVAGGTAVTAGWYVFAAVVQPDGLATNLVDHPLLAAQEGLGVFVSIYLSPTGNSVHTLIKTPATSVTVSSVTTNYPGQTYNDTFPVAGPDYSNADAVADWTSVSNPATSSNTTASPFQPQAGAASGAPGTVAYTQFKDGRFTTWNGTKGTFNGKWTVTPFEATTTGLSTGTVVTSPGYMWSSTTGYANDSFGVWLRHV